MKKTFSIFIACDDKNGIGKNWDLAWSIPEDMKYLKQTTTQTQDPQKQNAVIMGRKTWESIPTKFRPFSGRKNFILSRTYKNWDINDEGWYLYNSLDACMEDIETNPDIETVFIFWGAQIYNSVLSDPRLEKIYLTRVFWDYNCDVFFNGVPENFEKISESEEKNYQDIKYKFLIYKRKRNSGIISKIKSLIS